MSVLGIGIDLAEVARVQAALEHPRTGRRFRDRVYTPAEQDYCERRGRGRFQSYAARFAAKEATMKALGVGWGKDAGWLDIEVVRAAGARPTLRLSGAAAARAAHLGAGEIHLALTHTAELAMAEVVIEKP
jgi:holo-[acyl-carrier protein] synthase